MLPQATVFLDVIMAFFEAKKMVLIQAEQQSARPKA